MEKTVALTGHREIPDSIRPQLTALLDAELENRILRGAQDFRTGGAIGFDTLAAERILAARQKYPHIRLHLFLTCPSQTQGWAPCDVAIYEEILHCSDSYRYASPFYYDGVLQYRNRMLTADADVCIAYLTTSHGGTAYTAASALKNGAELINLADRLKSTTL